MNGMKEFIAELVHTAKDNNCTLFLSDYREANLNMSTMEIYGIPDLILKMYASTGLDGRRLKRAIVILKKTNDIRFAENVQVNKGLNARIFYDIDQAKDLLLIK